MGEDRLCDCKEKHQDHLCMLKCKGKTHKIKELTRTPNVACSSCGEEANSEDDVCIPMPLFV
jgi:hypothetical protein